MARLSPGALALYLLAAAAAGCAPEAPPRRFDFESMGTAAGLELRGRARVPDSLALARVQARFAAVEAAMSAWDPNSELSRVNRAPVDSTFTLSPLTGNCLALALELRAASGGAFEPGAGPLMKLWGFTRRQGRLPDPDSLAALLPDLGAYSYDASSRQLTRRHPQVALDLGGIAKGYAVDRRRANLRRAGHQQRHDRPGRQPATAWGCPRGGTPGAWGSATPWTATSSSRPSALVNQAVATSGSYERFVEIDGRRYGHIMNPATGRPAEGLLSATVVARSAAVADGLVHDAVRAGARRGRGPAARPLPQRGGGAGAAGTEGDRPGLRRRRACKGRSAHPARGYRGRYRSSSLDSLGRRRSLVSGLQSTQLPQSISRGGS